MSLIKSISILLVVFILTGSALADDPPELKSQIGGTIQSWFSVDKNDDARDMSFGIRRVRFRYYAQYDKTKLFVQTEITSGSLLDARIEYYFNESFNIRVGRFIGAGVRGGSLTSHTAIDIIERAYTAGQWAKLTVGSDYRDYGIQLEALTENITGRMWLHNGDGSLNKTNKPGSSAGAYFTSQAIDGMIIFQPQSIKGLEIGGHYGLGNKDITSTWIVETDTVPTRKEFSSYSAYAYYNPGGFQLKAELINFTHNDVDASIMGYYLFGGYNLTKSIELLGRYERYDADDEFILEKFSGKLITIGAALRDSDKINKLTAAIVLSSNEKTKIDDTVFQLEWQFVFKTK